MGELADRVGLGHYLPLEGDSLRVENHSEHHYCGRSANAPATMVGMAASNSTRTPDTNTRIRNLLSPHPGAARALRAFSRLNILSNASSWRHSVRSHGLIALQRTSPPTAGLHQRMS